MTITMRMSAVTTSIITITTMTRMTTTMSAAVDITTMTTMMRTSMSITIIMTRMKTMTMSIIMSMTRTAPAAVTIMTIITTIIMRDEVFTSWGKETVRKFSRAEIEEILKTLSEDSSYGVILRAKGMLEDENGTGPILTWFRKSTSSVTAIRMYTGRICVIGSKMDEAKLEKLWFERG